MQATSNGALQGAYMNSTGISASSGIYFFTYFPWGSTLQPYTEGSRQKEELSDFSKAELETHIQLPEQT